MGDQNQELDQSLVVKGDGEDNDDDGWGYTPPRASINLIYFVSLSMSIEYALLMPTVNQVSGVISSDSLSESTSLVTSVRDLSWRDHGISRDRIVCILCHTHHVLCNFWSME
jgi:hypothetical protein